MNTIRIFSGPRVASKRGGLRTAVLGGIIAVAALTVPATLLAKGPPSSAEPFQVYGVANSSPTFNGVKVIFDPVPEGKRLELKYVSSFAQLKKDSWMYCTLQIMDSDDDGQFVVAEHRVIVTSQTGQFYDFFMVSNPITLFADAGQFVQFDCVFKDQDGEIVNLSANLSGLLTDY